MANILSLKEVAEYFRMTMYTKEYHAMLVHYIEDKAHRVKEFGKGLYYIDVSNPEIITLMTERGNTDYSFLSTVNKNIDYFTRADIEVAYKESDTQQLLVLPSNQQLINALSNNLTIN